MTGSLSNENRQTSLWKGSLSIRFKRNITFFS
jgi:hypothetical protein